MRQNKKPKQTLESAQYGLEINFKASNLPIPEEHVPLIPDIPEKQTVKGVEARNI